MLLCCPVVKQIAPASASLLACALVLAGCGGPPEDASRADFCAQQQLVKEQTSWEDAKAQVRKLKDVGTPGDIPAEAREGFVEMVGYIEEAPSRRAFTQRVEGLSARDSADLDAFVGYVTETCPS